MSNQRNWLPVESVAFQIPASVTTSHDALQSHFDTSATSDRLRVRQRGWRGIWFYADVNLQSVNSDTTHLRGMIQPNLWLSGGLLVLLPLLKIVVVMSNPAQLWPLSLVFWLFLIAGIVGVLRQKQAFKQQLLHLPQKVQVMQSVSTPGHAVQRATATTPSTAAPHPSAQ
jgi:Flp pilus assembly protein TadB